MQHLSSEDAELRHIHPARDAERVNETVESGRSFCTEKQTCPIGVFDSGAGGLTILSALRQELPHEHYIYFGDTAHCPYGVRTDQEIIDLTLTGCQFLITQGVKIIVVACNTASQAALNTLRATYSLPFVGVVPAVKPAARATRKGRVGVAATNQAAKALYLRQLIDEFAEGTEVFAVGCPQLVTLVEMGQLSGPETEASVQYALQPLIDKDIDVLVLGCTHFPALRPVIEKIVGSGVKVIDSSTAIARRTHSVLDTEGMMRPVEQNVQTEGRLEIWCSGNPVAFSRVASSVLGYDVEARQADI